MKRGPIVEWMYDAERWVSVEATEQGPPAALFGGGATPHMESKTPLEDRYSGSVVL